MLRAQRALCRIHGSRKDKKEKVARSILATNQENKGTYNHITEMFKIGGAAKVMVDFCGSLEALKLPGIMDVPLKILTKHRKYLTN